MQLVIFIFAIFLCGSTISQQTDSPLCTARNCPAGKVCRVQKECSAPGSCSLSAVCLDNQVQGSHTFVCRTGQPIIERVNGQLQDLTCGPSIPCLNGTHCNSELMDTYATCCQNNPDAWPREGECPRPGPSNGDYCVDGCGNDNDCNWDYKCCNSGCRKECLRPTPVDPCRSKQCGPNTFCLRHGDTRCPRPGRCYVPGDCVPCETLSCAFPCQHGSVLDPNGCPTCTCMPPPVLRAPSINIRVSSGRSN